MSQKKAFTLFSIMSVFHASVASVAKALQCAMPSPMRPLPRYSWPRKLSRVPRIRPTRATRGTSRRRSAERSHRHWRWRTGTAYWVKRSYGMMVGEKKAKNCRKDVQFFLDGWTLIGDPTVPLFGPGVYLMWPDGEPHRDASMRPILESEPDSLEGRWVAMSPKQ